jgi:polysaccharide biosynthesis/export protein
MHLCLNGQWPKPRKRSGHSLKIPKFRTDFRPIASRPLGFRSVAAFAAAALLVSGCASKRLKGVEYNAPSAGVPDAVKNRTSGELATVNPLDLLNITTFGVPEFTGDFVVDETGQIQLPLVGGYAVAGKTARNLSAELSRVLGERYLRNPQVVVALKSQTSQRVTVDGAVREPGIFSFNGELTLIRAVAMAKGTTDNANTRRALVFRMIDGKRNAAAFDLRDIRRGLADDPKIYREDVVVVEGNGNKQLFRDFLSAVPLIAIFRPFN